MNISESISNVNSRYKDDVGRTKVDCKFQCGISWNSILNKGRYRCILRDKMSDDNCQVKFEGDSCMYSKPN